MTQNGMTMNMAILFVIRGLRANGIHFGSLNLGEDEILSLNTKSVIGNMQERITML